MKNEKKGNMNQWAGMSGTGIVDLRVIAEKRVYSLLSANLSQKQCSHPRLGEVCGGRFPIIGGRHKVIPCFLDVPSPNLTKSWLRPDIPALTNGVPDGNGCIMINGKKGNQITRLQPSISESKRCKRAMLFFTCETKIKGGRLNKLTKRQLFTFLTNRL
jgi:hypothetical protein